MVNKQKIFRLMESSGVFLGEELTYSADGSVDEDYADFNQIYSQHKAVSYISSQLVRLINGSFGTKKFAILGLACTGIPLASLIAYSMKLPFGYVRRSRKRYGTKKVVEGVEVQDVDRVVVVDDMIAKPAQTVPFIDEVKEAGFEVLALAVVFEKLPFDISRRVLEKKGIDVLSLLNHEDYKDERVKSSA